MNFKKVMTGIVLVLLFGLISFPGNTQELDPYLQELISKGISKSQTVRINSIEEAQVGLDQRLAKSTFIPKLTLNGSFTRLDDDITFDQETQDLLKATQKLLIKEAVGLPFNFPLPEGVPLRDAPNLQDKNILRASVDLDWVLFSGLEATHAIKASKHIQSVLMTLNAGIEIEGLKKQGMHSSQAMASYESFKINFNKMYNSTGNYVTFMLPGLLAGIMQQIIFLAMALVFARDFEDGYFGKLVGQSKNALYHILLKATPFLLMLPIMWIGIALFLPYFNVDISIFNVPMMVLASLLTFASMAIGMLFSIAIPNQLKATELLMVISTPAFILSGFTWPTMAIPTAISNIAQYIPLTQFLEGFRKVAFYGGDLSSIQTEIGMLTGITIVAFIAMVGLLQLKIYLFNKKAKKNVVTEG